MPSDADHQASGEVLGRYASKDNEHRFDELDEILHPEFAINGALGADGPLDLDAYQAVAERLGTAFPDLRIAPDEGLSRVFQDYLSAHRVRFTGTHTGAWYGVASTGNEVDVRCPWFAR